MKPLELTVHAPNKVWQPIRYRLTSPEAALRELRRLHKWIAEGVTCDQVNSRLLLRLVHWATAMDALLDGWLELTRREQDADVEAWWFLSWPGTGWPEWPAELDQPSEVAA